MTHPSFSQPGNGPEKEPNDPTLPELPRPGRLVHQPQEVPFGHAESRCFFEITSERPLAVTPAALERFGLETILACLYRLEHLARRHGGLDYLQVFEDLESGQELWLIEDEPGVVTALLPGDH